MILIMINIHVKYELYAERDIVDFFIYDIDDNFLRK